MSLIDDATVEEEEGDNWTKNSPIVQNFCLQ